MAKSGENSVSGPGVGLPVGSKIGKYEVVERSGVGGQSIVYKCYDRSLDRFVAAKQISPHLAEDPKFVERFRKEAQILARLGSEGTSIVAIHELLEEQQGLFIVMEFVQGHTLETILRDTAGPTETKAALQILWRLAAALHVVHTAGIIHRDLKPGNIIIAEGLRPKIADFGVAASRSGQTSMLLGTTKYMAPELFSGGDADGRADLYSLGMIAYELLLGRPEFNKVFDEIVRDPHSESLRWMKWHSNDQLTAPRLHELNPAIPEGLSDIVAKMMAKKPEERFASMEGLGRAIRVAFGPRSKAQVGAGAAAGGPRHRPDRAKAAAGAAAGAGGMAADEGDELDISAPPPTAAIPRKPMSLAAKLVLASVGVVVLLAGGMFLFVKAGAAGRAANRQAQILYQAGEANYAAGRFEDAIAQFDLVPPKYPGTIWAARAQVMLPFVSSRLAERDANLPDEWEKVARDETVAEDEAKRIVATTKDKEQADWARDIVSQIDDFRRNRPTLRQFRQEMARAQKAFDEKRYTGTGGVIDILNLLSTSGLSPEQKRMREDLRQKALLADFNKRYADLIARGDELAGTGGPDKDMDFDNSKAAYEQAVALLQAPPEKFAPSEIETRSKDLSHKLDWLNHKRDYKKAQQDLGNAGNNVPKKLAALYRMKDLLNWFKMPVDQVNKQIAQANAEEQTGKAQEAFDSKKLDLALTLAKKAQEFVPGYKPAQDLIDKILKGQSRSDLIAQGDAHAAKGEDDLAMVDYLGAEKIQADPDLSAKIKGCRVRLMWKDVIKKDADGKFAEAKVVLEQIRGVDSAEGTKADAYQAKLDLKINYQILMDKGDAAFAAKQWHEAKGLYERAQRTLPSPEAKRKIALATYMENYQMAADAKANSDKEGARAYAQIAKRYVKDAAAKQEDTDKLNADCDAIVRWADGG